MIVNGTHTKHSIPDDENSGVVLVYAVAIDSVVHTMVAGSIEDVFKWTQRSNRLQSNFTPFDYDIYAYYI